MEIMHELNQLDFGGAERVVKNIIEYDTENKHSIICYKDGPFRKELEKSGANIFLIKEEEREEKEFSADIIHVHTGGNISQLGICLAGSFPLIETIHSPVRSVMLDRFVSKRVGVSDVVTKLNDNCITIENGIDIEETLANKSKVEIRKELGIPEKSIVVGRLGRLGYDKGLEEWLLACYYAQRKGFDFVPLVVGGDARGCEGYLGRLKLMAASLPVKNIIFTGLREDIGDMFEAMDIFLYPSPTEGFGLVYMEAMLNGCVVVAYENDVTRSLIGGHAILTKPNIQGLIDGLEKVRNEDIRVAIQGICSEYVIKNFSAERMSINYQNLYTDVYGHFNRKN